MKCFTSVMAENKVACHHLHSPGVGQCVPERGGVQFHVCHWAQEGGCHFTSWADNLHVNMLGDTAVVEEEAVLLHIWPADQQE